MSFIARLRLWFHYQQVKSKAYHYRPIIILDEITRTGGERTIRGHFLDRTGKRIDIIAVDMSEGDYD